MSEFTDLYTKSFGKTYNTCSLLLTSLMKLRVQTDRIHNKKRRAVYYGEITLFLSLYDTYAIKETKLNCNKYTF